MNPEPIELFQYPPGLGLSSLSPFCTKVEVYFQLTGINYRCRVGNPRLAPHGKLPYIRYNEELVGDSSQIIRRCQEWFVDTLDHGLDSQQRRTSHLLQRTIEEHFYWALVYSRWIDDSGWSRYREEIVALLPAALRWFLPAVLRRQVRGSLHQQGLGRHPPAEIYRRGIDDLNLLASILGDGPFIHGPRPTTIDATAYAFIWHTLDFPVDTPLTTAAHQKPELVNYVDRMNEQLDWPDITAPTSST